MYFKLVSFSHKTPPPQNKPVVLMVKSHWLGIAVWQAEQAAVQTTRARWEEESIAPKCSSIRSRLKSLPNRKVTQPSAHSLFAGSCPLSNDRRQQQPISLARMPIGSTLQRHQKPFSGKRQCGFWNHEPWAIGLHRNWTRGFGLELQMTPTKTIRREDSRGLALDCWCFWKNKNTIYPMDPTTVWEST